MPPQRTRDILSRSLEVTTDAPPTLAIISPTPRAFTFPINDSHDSPYSSPSSSPFDPDHLSLSSPTDCFPSSPSPPPSSHIRRKSSSSTDIDRRPKKGDEDYVKRPENAFILFRRKCCEDRHADANSDPSTKKQRQADLSKTISQQWKGLSLEERQYWEALAKEKKKEHEQMYPNYVYRPQRSKDKDGRSKSRKPKGVRGEHDHETDSESLSFVLPFTAPPPSRHHGRSASMPTPPLPYQNIQIPNVYMPSCPTSPSLMPMISRRASHPDHPHPRIAHFDYLPNSGLMPPSFGQAGQFESTLQPSEFFHGMFDMPAQSDRNAAARSALQPLSMVHDQLLHQLVSPTSSIASGSSGPSSPHAGPFTPTTMLANSFTHLRSSDAPLQHSSPGLPEQPQPHTEADLAELQMQQDLYASYASWENAALWPSTADSILLGDDFDLNAIPAIELGVPKFGEDMSMGEMAAASSAMGMGMQGYGQEFTQGVDEGGYNETLFGFDEMMAGHGF